MTDETPKRRCICPGCDRAQKGNSQICPRCSRYVPAVLWLAIHDHADAWRSGGELQPFIAWSWDATINLASWEASRYRRAKRYGLEADAPGSAVYGLTPTGQIERTDLRRAMETA